MNEFIKNEARWIYREQVVQKGARVAVALDDGGPVALAHVDEPVLNLCVAQCDIVWCGVVSLCGVVGGGVVWCGVVWGGVGWCRVAS